MKKLLALRAAALCLTSLCVVGAAHAAGGVDASNSIVTCSTFTKAVLKPKPTLVIGGTLPATISVKGKLTACVTNNAGITSIGGSFKGTLTMLNDCAGFNNATGTLTFKWKASPGLLDSTSTVTVNMGSVSPNLFVLGSASYGQLQLGSPPGAALAVSGSFTGGDGGATSTGNLILSQDQNAFQGFCSSTGIKELNIGVGTITLQ